MPVALAAVWKAACDQSMAGVVDDSGTEEGAGQLLGRIVTEVRGREAGEGGRVRREGRRSEWCVALNDPGES